MPGRAQAMILLVLVHADPSPASAASSAPQVTNGGYMRTTGAQGQPVVLPLKHTEVEAEVAGVVASVRLAQRFHNPYGRPIEATYVFPLPHTAAVHEMAITVGARRIRGRARERGEARRIYLRARAQGKTAALLDEQRPNIFTQSVANIMPGEEVRVEIRYVELLSPNEGRYEFVFPMVVGPRYVGGEKRPGGGTTTVPDAARITPRLLARGLRPGHDIALRLIVRGGRAVRDVEVVAHQAQVTTTGGAARITLDPRDSIPNRDFVVRYVLAGAEPEAMLLAHRDRSGRGHFLLAVHPRARPPASEIAPREYIFVVDNSGSMDGFPIEQARAAVKRLLGTIRARDTFQLIKFAGVPDQYAPRPIPGTPKNVRAAERWLATMEGRGGTELLLALKACLRTPKDPARSRIIFFLTDGFVGDEAQILKFLRDHLGGANLFALGVGTSVNRYLIDGLARLGAGEPFYLLKEEEGPEVTKRVFALLSRPSLTDIRIDWAGLQVEELAPRALGDLFAERPIVLSGRYRRPGAATVTIRGRLAGRPFVHRLPVTLPAQATEENRAVPLLWARRKIAALADLESIEPDRAPQAKKETIRVALAYNLASKYTSFVAVDEVVRNKGGQQLGVPVPLPLPAKTSPRAAPPGATTTDSDGDRIPDVDDQCPNEPETYNGVEDDDGCPDMGRVVVHRGRIEILDKVYFETGRARVKAVSFPILDAIAATLKGNPQILLIEIQGHSDERRERFPTAADLALQRAQAVRRYLVNKGIAAERLVVKSYGATRPLRRGHNEAAWSANRRVEFVILKRVN